MNEHGLLPPGIHSCTLQEAEDAFCWNGHRRTLWEKFKQALGEFRALGFSRHALIVDGSFVTDKDMPGDVEVLIDLQNADAAEQDRITVYFFRNHTRLHTECAVDFYPNLPGGNNFALFFQYVGEKTAAMKALDAKEKKGILRIERW